MEHDSGRLVGQLLERLGDVVGRDCGELVDLFTVLDETQPKDMCRTHTAIDEKALESSHTLFYQRLQLGRVSRYQATIEADIYPALALCSRDFLIEACHRGGWRNRIQWHINDSSDTSECSSSCTGPEPFPFCPSGLVKMYMSVHKAGNEDVR